jgi:hypothetical protein
MALDVVIQGGTHARLVGVLLGGQGSGSEKHGRGNGEEPEKRHESA